MLDRIRACIPALPPATERLRAAEPPLAGDPLGDPVPIAIGVLMHRYSLPRREAHERLKRLAASDGRSPRAQAQALLEAVELLSRPALG